MSQHESETIVTKQLTHLATTEQGESERRGLQGSGATEEAGESNSANGTPTFFINGERHDTGFDFEALVAAIETELVQGEMDACGLVPAGTSCHSVIVSGARLLGGHGAASEEALRPCLDCH
jgi:hypothetical protein